MKLEAEVQLGAGPVRSHAHLPGTTSHSVASEGRFDYLTAVEMPKESRAKKSAGARILIVDDEEDLRTLLGHVLSNAGYEIREVSDGKQAIAALQEHKYDLALLDIQMPTVNGIQVLKFINDHCPHTKAIMLTGYADLKHAMEAKEFGAKEFIGKPYKLEDILATIERLLKE